MSDIEWDQLQLWENERVRAEVWLNFSAGGWQWSVTHRGQDHEWSTIDSGLRSSPTDCYRAVALVMDALEGF